MPDADININNIDICKTKWISRKDLTTILEKNFIPPYSLEEIFSYTMGNLFLIELYIENYDIRKDSLALLKEKVIQYYEDNFCFSSVNEYNLIASCCNLDKVSFTLFANLAYHYRLSSYSLNKLIRNRNMFYEENGYYRFYPFFHDYLKKKIEQELSRETQEKQRRILVSNLVVESNFLVEYYSYTGSKIEKIAMEKRIVETIASQGCNYYGSKLLTLVERDVIDKGLKVLLMLLSEQEMKPKSISYLIDELKDHQLIGIIRGQAAVYYGRRLDEEYAVTFEESDESTYLQLMCSWLKGTNMNQRLPENFFVKHGFYNVPDHLIHVLDDMALLKEGDNRQSSFQGRLTAFYKCCLKGETKKSERLFHYIIKWYREFLLNDYPGSYYFMLGWSFYNKRKSRKAMWYLEEGLKKINFRSNRVFMLKFYNLQSRILFEEKDNAGLVKLLLTAKENLGSEKPFSMFIEYLRSCIRLLDGKPVKEVLDDPLTYSMGIGDEITAVQYYSYSLSKEERKDNNLLKVQEGMLSTDQLAIYRNTSLLDFNKRTEIEINFFGTYTFKVNKIDYADEFLNRKKLRKILNYLVFNSPNMVSREEIKRVFWDSEKAYDLDANLRVTICNIRKILDKIGYSDMIVCEQARIYINKHYEVNNDFKKYVSLYKKAKVFYKNGETYQAESYLKRIASLNIDIVFKDLNWDYLENKVRNQVQLIICNSLEMLLEISKRNNNLQKAEDYARRLTGMNSKYLGELLALLQKNNHKEEADELMKKINKKDKSLTNIFFPE